MAGFATPGSEGLCLLYEQYRTAKGRTDRNRVGQLLFTNGFPALALDKKSVTWENGLHPDH